MNRLHLRIRQKVLNDDDILELDRNRVETGRLEQQDRVWDIGSQKTLDEGVAVFSWIDDVANVVKHKLSTEIEDWNRCWLKD